MSYNYKDTYHLMRKFHDLGKNEVLIMDYLFDKPIAEVTYSELAKAIGKNDMSNIRKAAMNLEDMGLISICRKWDEEEFVPKKPTNNPMVACFIKDDWLEALLDKPKKISLHEAAEELKALQEG